MERIIRENIQKASFLSEQVKAAEMRHGCLEVAIQALGGNIHPHDVIHSYNGKRNLHHSLERRGLAYDWMIDTTRPMSVQDLEGILDFRYPGQEAEGDFRGHIISMEPIREEKVEGHGIAVIPNAHLPRDVRNRLVEYNMHFVVDGLADSGIIMVRSNTLAQHLNTCYEFPRKVTIARVRKFRDIPA